MHEAAGPARAAQGAQALAEIGAGHRDVRIVAAGCFDLCPKRGVTLARGRDLGGAAMLHVLDNGDGADVAVRWMLDLNAI